MNPALKKALALVDPRLAHDEPVLHFGPCKLRTEERRRIAGTVLVTSKRLQFVSTSLQVRADREKIRHVDYAGKGMLEAVVTVQHHHNEDFKREYGEIYGQAAMDRLITRTFYDARRHMKALHKALTN